MSKPTAILVHGALTGASIWSGVIDHLQAADWQVFAPALPLRALTSDVDYLESVLATVDGPVILVGHSYGGSIISHPRFSQEAVYGLVYIAGFAPDSDESTSELNARWPGSGLNADNIITRQYPGGVDLYLRPEKFGEVYAGDLPPRVVARMACSQRPIDVGALDGKFSEPPAWSSRPASFLISTEDRSLVPEAQRFMAKRARATILEVAAAHASPLSQPAAVARLIDLTIRGRKGP